MRFLMILSFIFTPVLVLAGETSTSMPDLTTTLVPALGSVLIALLTWLSYFLANLIRAKVQNTYLQGALIRADDAIFSAVKMVSQTYVDAIKDASADGKLTQEEKYAAKVKAIEAAKSFLGVKGLAMLTNVLGITGPALDGYLGGKIEAAVQDVKAVPSQP